MKKDLSKYNWDLSKLLYGYTLNDLYRKWLVIGKNYEKSIAHLADSKVHFIKWFKQKRLWVKVYANLSRYIHESGLEEPDNEKWKQMETKLDEVYAKFIPNLQAEGENVLKNKETIDEWLETERFKNYKRFFQLNFYNNILKMNEVERGVRTALIGNGPIMRILNTLNAESGNLVVKIVDKDGKEINDTPTNLLIHEDQNIRKQAWFAFRNAKAYLRHTYAEIFYWCNMRSDQQSQLNKHENFISQTLAEYEISFNDYKNIINNCLIFKDYFVRYKNHAQKMYKISENYDEVKPWDIDRVNRDISVASYSIPEAQKEIAKSLFPLGKEYIDILVNVVFKERWIDWIHEKRSKFVSINYSIPSYNMCPICISFENNSYDVVTVSHEIGHSICSYLAQKNQDIYYWTHQLTSEISSFTNEMLTNFYLLNKYNDDIKKVFFILKSILNRFFETVMTYSSYEHFRLVLNDIYQKNQQPIGPDDLEKLYQKNMEYREGLSEEEKKWKEDEGEFGAMALSLYNELAYNFEVFDRIKYILGQVIGLILAYQIYFGNKKVRDAYFKFLKAGSCESPLTLLKRLGINFTSDKIFTAAKKILSEFITKFERIKIDKNGNYVLTKSKN